MSTVALAADPRPATGYFQKQSPVWLILCTFGLLTLPLTVLAISQRDVLDRWHLGMLYVVGLGTTHFILTFTVYLQSSNLRYFSSTWMNRILYFLIPVFIFVFFDLYRTLHVAAAFPLCDLVLFWGIRFFDFHHFTRQSYGVSQLFKGRAKCPFPGWIRKAESLYFFGLTVLLMRTFIGGGHFDGTRVETLFILGCVLILLATVLAGFIVAWKRSENPVALLVPLAYFTLQSVSAGLAIYNSSLYLLCLATHYVEYHVLMVPRCFHTRLDSESRVDRIFAHLRQNKVIFYLVLLLVAGLVTLLTWGVMGMMASMANTTPDRSYLVLIALFDGLFVFHYFIESFIWKFSIPHYRQTLGPLYFGQKPATRPA